MNDFVRHEPCPECGSKDNVAVYCDKEGYESKYCFGCGYTVPSKQLLAKGNKDSMSQNQQDEVEEKDIEDFISKEEVSAIQQKTKRECNGYRGIRDDVKKFYGVRTEFDDDGEVLATYYPVTTQYRLSGYKRRRHPKLFDSIGYVNRKSDLFGQFRYKDISEGKTVLIVGGEADTEAAYQMLKDYYVNKGWDQEPVVVSAVAGELSTPRQLANNYNFLNKFQKIIIGLDNDKAGKEAAEKCVERLPKGKVFVATWSKGKDPNEMLLKGETKAFLNDYYSAKQYVPVGIVASNQISEAMREELKIPKIPLPPFMYKLEDMMAGGIPLGRIVNVGSASGTGKSTIVDELIYHWIFHSPHRCGIVTLESTVGQYGIKLLSRHITNKIELLRNADAISLLETEQVKKKEYELFNKEDGEARFFLVDDRDGGTDNIKDAIENLIIACGCKVIVCDPIQDVIGSLPIDEQEKFMNWQKGMIKSHACTFINICHTRKSTGNQKAGSQGADLAEEDIFGSSSIYKSAACNLMFGRNKEAEDELERNTTIMKATKIRWTGKTGVAGKYYYSINEHKLYDLDDYLQQNS